jgi:F0F1-type ATP synthase delta subunit
MIFVNEIDVFLFYEYNVPKQVYLTAETLNKQLKNLIRNDMIIQNNIEYLWNIFNTLYENSPLDILNNLTKQYYEKTEVEKNSEYIKLFIDFGTIKHWI